MNYTRLEAKEKELMAEIDILIEKANKCDADEDNEYKEKTGYEIPEDLKFKNEKMELENSKEIYKKRKVIVEPVLGPNQVVPCGKSSAFRN